MLPQHTSLSIPAEAADDNHDHGHDQVASARGGRKLRPKRAAIAMISAGSLAPVRSISTKKPSKPPGVTVTSNRPSVVPMLRSDDGIGPAEVGIGRGELRSGRRSTRHRWFTLEGASTPTRLFDRTTRRVTMTEAGTVFLHHARRIVTEIRAAENALQDLSKKPKGRLRIATSVNFAALFLSKELPEFCQRYPGIKVTILADDNVVDVALAGADVSIRFGTAGPPGTVSGRLAKTEFVLCASRKYVEQYGSPRTAADLLDHPCLPFRGGPVQNGDSSWAARPSRSNQTAPSNPAMARSIEVSSLRATA
jgi:hypothetical protein